MKKKKLRHQETSEERGALRHITVVKTEPNQSPFGSPKKKKPEGQSIPPIRAKERKWPRERIREKIAGRLLGRIL